MANAINRTGGHARLTILADNDHNCWDYVYVENGEDILGWLQSQRREM